MVKKSCFLLFLTVLTVSVFAEESKMKIAILDLIPTGVSRETAQAVSDLLRTELFKIGLFTILERQQIDAIVKEQKLSLTGMTEDQYAAKIGNLLSANKVMVGTVMKLGDIFHINVRIIDVEKGVMEVGENAQADNETMLDRACEVLSSKLADLLGGTNKQNGVKLKMGFDLGAGGGISTIGPKIIIESTLNYSFINSPILFGLCFNAGYGFFQYQAQSGDMLNYNIASLGAACRIGYSLMYNVNLALEGGLSGGLVPFVQLSYNVSNANMFLLFPQIYLVADLFHLFRIKAGADFYAFNNIQFGIYGIISYSFGHGL